MLGLPFIQDVLTASTVMYDHAEHCPIRLRAWTGLIAWLYILGAVLEAAHTLTAVRLLRK